MKTSQSQNHISVLAILTLSSLILTACSEVDRPAPSTTIAGWEEDAKSSSQQDQVSSSRIISSSSCSAMVSSSLNSQGFSSSSSIPLSSSKLVSSSSKMLSSSLAISSSRANSSSIAVSSSLAPSSSLALSSSSLSLSSSSSFNMQGVKNNQDCVFNSSAKTLTCLEQVYETVVINGLVWMAENLNVGTMVNGSNGQNQQSDGMIEKFCYADNAANCGNKRGGLYQWPEVMGLSANCLTHSCAAALPAVNIQGICPNGWHIPSYTEWYSIVPFQSGELDGIRWSKMRKNTGEYPAWDAAATNTTGFGLYPAGYRSEAGSFGSVGTTAFYMLAGTESSDTEFGAEVISASGMNGGPSGKRMAAIVRCVKDP